MSNLNKRLFEKYIEKVGWPELLYQTLREVYVHSVNGSPNLKETLEEVKNILETYEEGMVGRVKVEDNSTPAPFVTTKQSPGKEPSNNVSPIVEEAGTVVEGNKREVKLNPILEIQKPKVNLPEGGRKEILRVTVKLPLEDLEPKPRSSKVKVAIDSALGSSKGSIPIPVGYKIVNRNQLTITTTSGMFLGQGSEDGQIKRSDRVSGYIRESGEFSLVFQDTGLGEALIIYQIVRERNPKMVELKMICSEDKNTAEWVGYIRDPEIIVKADVFEEARNQVLDVLKSKHNMEIVSCALLKKYDEDGKEVILKQEYPQLGNGNFL